MAKKQQNQKRNTKRPSRAVRSPGSFGPVSQINTAPVSVGNSVRGSRPRVTQTTNGARVVGRDFAFALSGTAAAVTGFELIGGMPITPCALPSSVLRNYCQMFQKFKVNKIIAHYITSSPTSQAGDVLFYYERDRFAPMPDYSSSNFLPFVLSDPDTIIGPQWTNHSALISPVPEWKTTLYANQTDLNEDAAGTMFFFSKTNAANSPGYLLIDYDIEFKQLSVNVRAGVLPVARAQSSFVCFTWPATLTAGNIVSAAINSGKNIANVTSAAPTGYTAGDVYKVVFQITSSTQVNAAWSGTGTTPTTANLITYADGTAITLDDGFTCYASSIDGTNFNFSPTLEGIIVAGSEGVTTGPLLEYGITNTVNVVNVCAEMQLVRNFDSFTQSSY
jgi:hypothetical protein